jgi:hypothetical protein
MRRRLVIALVAIGLLGGLGGCVTPSIPIPPPSPDLMVFALQTDDQGQVHSASLTYPATDNYKGGLVYVFNRAVGRGIIETVNANGSIGPTRPFEAAVGHVLIVSVERDDQTVSSCVTLREGTPLNDCP